MLLWSAPVQSENTVSTVAPAADGLAGRVVGDGASVGAADAVGAALGGAAVADAAGLGVALDDPQAATSTATAARERSAAVG
ncbi:MAG: hypothetical protein U0838_11675 [Chloroflexota bacterium]